MVLLRRAAFLSLPEKKPSRTIFRRRGFFCPTPAQRAKAACRKFHRAGVKSTDAFEGMNGSASTKKLPYRTSPNDLTAPELKV